MTKKEKEKEVSRHYRFELRLPFFAWAKICFRLVHQILSLTGINFQTKSIIGYVVQNIGWTWDVVTLWHVTYDAFLVKMHYYMHQYINKYHCCPKTYIITFSCNFWVVPRCIDAVVGVQAKQLLWHCYWAEWENIARGTTDSGYWVYNLSYLCSWKIHHRR